MKKTIWKLFTLLLLFSFIATPTLTQAATPDADRLTTSEASMPTSDWILLEEGFEGEDFPPAGWSVERESGDCDWTNESARPNETGGTGLFAIADSDACGSGTTMDTVLRSPVLDLSEKSNVFLEFKYDYFHLGTSRADVDISVDNGMTWATIWTRDASDRGPKTATLDLSEFTGSEETYLRFRYVAPSWHWWWQVDDVRVEVFDAAIQVSPESLASSQQPDTQVTLPLEILNSGSVDLIWDIEETPGFGEGPMVVSEPAPSIPAEVFTGMVPEDYQPLGVGELSSPAGPWETLTSAPFVSLDNVYIGYEGKGYQIGGYGTNGQVGIYDAKTDTWTTGASAPEPWIVYPVDGCFGFNADGDPVGVLFPDTSSPVTTLHRYNIATDSWDTPPVPSGFPEDGLWAHAIASVYPYTGENVCYISGGATASGGGDTSALYAYYPDTNTVENLGNFDYIAQGFAFHATWYAPWIGTEGGICVGGGVNVDSVVTADTQCYDIGAGVFNAANADLGALPAGLWSMATGILIEGGDYQLWVAQGADTNFALWPNSAYYSYENDQWNIGPTPPRAGYRVGGTNIATEFSSGFYVVGGSSAGFTPTSGHERYFLTVCDVPGDVDWLSVSPDSGVTAPGAIDEVMVTFDSTGIDPGEYQAYLCVNSNDPAQPLTVVPIEMEVFITPIIGVNPEVLESSQVTDAQVTLPLDILNTGWDDLNWTIAEAPGLNTVQTGWGIEEGFDDITLLEGLGWAMTNNSDPLGQTGWFQGNTGVFPSHSGDPDSYIGANFNNTSGAGTISNWLLTPEIIMNNGDVFSFYTRRTTSQWEDRLQVRLSTNGDSTDVGSSATSVGDFDTLLLDINPTYEPGGYPTVWTQYEITISGLTEPTSGRLAFRYFVEDGGPGGTNSDYIGIDTVQYTLPCDNPQDVGWLSALPTSGQVTPGELDTLQVTIDSTGLEAGSTHAAFLCVLSDDIDNPIVPVPVSLNVVENEPPVAEDQAVETDQDTPVEITLVATDPDGDALTYMIVDEPENGTLEYEEADLPVLTYVPDEGWFGEDSFTFVANDGWEDSNIATVTITVIEVDQTFHIFMPLILR